MNYKKFFTILVGAMFALCTSCSKENTTNMSNGNSGAKDDPGIFYTYYPYIGMSLDYAAPWYHDHYESGTMEEICVRTPKTHLCGMTLVVLDTIMALMEEPDYEIITEPTLVFHNGHVESIKIPTNNISSDWQPVIDSCFANGIIRLAEKCYAMRRGTTVLVDSVAAGSYTATFSEEEPKVLTIYF